LENLTIPVTANIGGNYTSPQVTTDLTSGVKTLTSKLVEIEKQKLINKGKDKASDLLGGLLSGNKTTNDTTATTSDEKKVWEVCLERKRKLKKTLLTNR